MVEKHFSIVRWSKNLSTNWAKVFNYPILNQLNGSFCYKSHVYLAVEQGHNVRGMDVFLINLLVRAL